MLKVRAGTATEARLYVRPLRPGEVLVWFYKEDSLPHSLNRACIISAKHARNDTYLRSLTRYMDSLIFSYKSRGTFSFLEP